MNPLDAIVPFYDLDFGGLQADLDFYLNWARSEGSPILEVGCGTGRVLTYLAKAGFQVTGVDSSAAFLEVARQKLSGALKRRTSLVQADARKMDLDKEFSLTIVALNTFAHLTSLDDQLQVLGRIHRHLRLGGLVILDLVNPYGILDATDNALVLAWLKPNPQGPGTVAKLVSTTIEPTQQLQQVIYFYDTMNEAGQITRTTVTFALKYCFPNEVRLLLGRIGFQAPQLYGSYELEDFTPTSDRMIVLARK